MACPPLFTETPGLRISLRASPEPPAAPSPALLNGPASDPLLPAWPIVCKTTGEVVLPWTIMQSLGLQPLSCAKVVTGRDRMEANAACQTVGRQPYQRWKAPVSATALGYAGCLFTCFKSFSVR